MRLENSIALVIVTLGGALGFGACGGSHRCEHGVESAAGAPDLLDPNPAPATIQVTLPSLAEGRISAESVFGGFGCTGGNRSLAVSWTAGPDRTQSYALIIHDP